MNSIGQASPSVLISSDFGGQVAVGIGIVSYWPGQSDSSLQDRYDAMWR